jgi:hypothetical protein
MSDDVAGRAVVRARLQVRRGSFSAAASRLANASQRPIAAPTWRLSIARSLNTRGYGDWVALLMSEI